MHMRDRSLRIRRRRIENVRDTAVRHELLVHGHLELGDGAVGAEDFAEVGGVDVFR